MNKTRFTPVRWVPTFAERKEILVAKQTLSTAEFKRLVRKQWAHLSPGTLSSKNLAIWEVLVPVAERLGRMESKSLPSKSMTAQEREQAYLLGANYKDMILKQPVSLFGKIKLFFARWNQIL